MLPGRYRFDKPVGHALKDSLDVDELGGLLRDQMKPTIRQLNSERQQSAIASRDWREVDYATWERELQSQVEQLCKEKRLTIILCDSPSKYAEALSKHSVGPFTEKEEKLLNKYVHFTKDSTTTEETELDQPSSEQTDDIKPNRIVKPYVPGEHYASDPGGFHSDEDDDSHWASQ